MWPEATFWAIRSHVFESFTNDASDPKFVNDKPARGESPEWHPMQCLLITGETSVEKERTIGAVGGFFCDDIARGTEPYTRTDAAAAIPIHR